MCRLVVILDDFLLWLEILDQILDKVKGLLFLANVLFAPPFPAIIGHDILHARKPLVKLKVLVVARLEYL